MLVGAAPAAVRRMHPIHARAMYDGSVAARVGTSANALLDSKHPMLLKIATHNNSVALLYNSLSFTLSTLPAGMVPSSWPVRS